ncbi:MAG: glycosyltransferase [Flavobacteriia bacterium]|nr:glycosyltransferase [Flavobacteriia bacterium]
MKILHIIPNLKKGGAERIVIDIVRILNQNTSNQVKLILFEDKIEYDIKDIKKLIEIVPSKVQLSITKRNQLNITELQNTIELFQPDSIHSHLFEAEIVSRSCTFPNAKWFSHSHNRMISLSNLNPFSIKSKRDLTNYFEKRYLLKRYRKNGGNNFIAISEDISNFLRTVLPKDLQRIHLLQNAIEIKRFERPMDFNKVRDNVFNMVSIGRLDKNKNHQLLIDVVLELKKRGIPVHLTILGEGVERIPLQEKIVQLNLSNQLSLVGLQEKVEMYLWNADLYLHSAIYEGFGLAIIEAMACGLPVVCTDGRGNRDLIQEGENGFMVGERDPKLLADKIELLLKNDILRQEMGEKARKFAQGFGIKKYVDQLLLIYKS